GLSTRARVIIYNKAAGAPAGLETYADLADPAYRGDICIRSSSNIYNISLLAGLIDHLGPEKAEAWARGVVANLGKPPSGNDTSNIKAVASGQCAISIVNSYYVARFLDSGDAAGRKIGIIHPNQSSTGTHVNISGAGVLKHSPNRKNAIRFLEYLTEARAQSLFVAGNNEYPVVSTATVPKTLKGFGEFTEDTINASALGKNQADAVRIYDRAGWR
ncbi:MAG: extracellular solute-binding protein, partial [Myxococcota bacterium]